MIWTEKYRPRKLDDIVGLDLIKKKIAFYVENPSEFPQCMIFCGKAGTGKTSMAYVIANELYGEQHNSIKFSSNFFDFNASDDRGIDFIRHHIRKLLAPLRMMLPLKSFSLMKPIT